VDNPYEYLLMNYDAWVFIVFDHFAFSFAGEGKVLQYKHSLCINRQIAKILHTHRGHPAQDLLWEIYMPTEAEDIGRTSPTSRGEEKTLETQINCTPAMGISRAKT